MKLQPTYNVYWIFGNDGVLCNELVRSRNSNLNDIYRILASLNIAYPKAEVIVVEDGDLDYA